MSANATPEIILMAHTEYDIQYVAIPKTDQTVQFSTPAAVQNIWHQRK